MNIVHKEGYHLITSDEDSFSSFFKNFSKAFSSLEKNHVIIQLSENLNVVKDEISLFLDFSSRLQQNGMSFVVIIKNVNVDDFPEEFNIVPTLVEAEDVIDMENMQRELGF
ncbi:hypothetical protein OD91_2483 [Lutibacter sp. Hel_I_33_5]|uniref:hypothetical protein n=1 Tax=Lutibacter sp. Hel_I_33_5 TaxID=1566289 RepID=UPI00119C9DD8|nr:hypothetical protein [Lutibacter sp. Hel_I_33_5]TVZ57175.1 hypothetical protein OD91_2483 [Lutibacter sp. Hel_I_33_5]